jgi:hypothetical protein
MTYTAAQVLAAINPYITNPAYRVASGAYQPSQSGPPWNGPFTIYIYQLPTNPAVFVFVSSGAIDCDGGTSDICLADTQGQPTTSWEPAGRDIDASIIPFYVLPQTPADPGMFNYPDHNIQLGQSGAMIYNNQMIFGALADERGCLDAPCAQPEPGDDGIGKDIGELSYAACILLGNTMGNCDPNIGGIDNGVTYLVFSGASNALPSNIYPTIDSINSVSSNALNQMMSQLIGPPMVCSFIYNQP